MNLFEEAMKHIIHICRVIALPSYNALLLGPRLVGKKASALAAAFLMGATTFVYYVEKDKNVSIALFQKVWKTAVFEKFEGFIYYF